MSNSIRLHPKHGVNPTCGVCFWCGESDGTVALLGAAYKGEAPREMVLSYEPCDSCKQRFAQGIMLAEVTEHSPDGRPSIATGPTLYPTGRYMVMKESAFKHIFMGDIVEQTLAKRRAFIDTEAFEHLLRAWEGNGASGTA